MITDSRKKEIDNFTEQLSNFVNSFSSKEELEYVAKKISTDHRALQQNTMRLFLTYVEHAASNEYKTDARNEATQKVAKELLKGFQSLPNHENSKPTQWLPFI